jgi:hypothetical protein
VLHDDVIDRDGWCVQTRDFGFGPAIMRGPTKDTQRSRQVHSAYDYRQEEDVADAHVSCLSSQKGSLHPALAFLEIGKSRND